MKPVLLRLAMVVISLGLSLFAIPTLAADGSKAVLPASDTVSANYYAVGQTVEVKDAIESDVMVVGGNVTVTGEVGGDVLVLGGNVRISGPVTGNVRVLGGDVELAGSVGHNVSVVAGSLVADKNSRVLGHVSAATGSLELRGVVEGGLQAAGGDVVLSGEIKGPVELWLGSDGALEVTSTAVTGAEFTYHASGVAQVSPSAKLAQTPVWRSLNLSGGRSGSRVGWLISLFSSLALTLVIAGLLPKKLIEVAGEALAHPWASLGRGALWALAGPVAVVILFMTLIGWSLATVLLAVYLMGALVAKVVAGAAVGWWLRSLSYFKFMQSWSIVVVVLVGVMLYRLVTFIPGLGVLVSLLATLWAWGALVQVQRRTLASLR